MHSISICRDVILRRASVILCKNITNFRFERSKETRKKKKNEEKDGHSLSLSLFRKIAKNNRRIPLGEILVARGSENDGGASITTEWRNRAWRIEAIDGAKSLIIRQSGMIGDTQAVVASCNSQAALAVRCAAWRGVADGVAHV